MLNRAWSILDVKSIDDEQRVLEGIASTPTPDGSGHVMDPKGAQYELPIPLLWFHNQKEPIGEVFAATVTADGIRIKARISKFDEPGKLKDRLDEAWHSIKAKLVKGLSIGWSPIDYELIKGTTHVRFTKWFWGELSAVTLPMNTEATITAVKSADLAATGHSHNQPGDAGLPVKAVKAATSMSNTVTEQISSFENTRASKLARMNELVAKSAGQTLDQTQSQEYEDLEREIEAIDGHLPRLRRLEKTNVATATPLAGVVDTKTGSEARGGVSHQVVVTPNVPKGTAFTRYVMAKIVGKNSTSDAIRYVEQNKQWMDQTPEVLLALKAAVNPGTTAEPAWAAPLAVTRPMQEEWLELLRPVTLIGQLTGLKRVPFNISIPVQTGGGTYAWVGEGAPKPVGNLQFSSATLPIAKSAGIIVISEELAKISTPSAEAVVRNDMIKGMAQFLDQQFIDPTVAAVTNVSPASITNGANGYATAGTSGDNARTDVKKGITLMTAGNYPISELVFIMSEANAFALSAALTSNGQPLFPGMTMKGGSLFGVPTVTSQSAGSVVATVHTPSILYADDGGVNIDVSREATVEFNTVPTSPITASSVYVSLWQANLIGLRAERFINWKRVARPGAQPVVYTTATYV